MDAAIIAAVRTGLILAFQAISTWRGILAAAGATEDQIAGMLQDAADEAQAELDGLDADLGRGE